MITIYRLADDSIDFDPIGQIVDGEIVTGNETIQGLVPAGLLDTDAYDEAELVQRIDGPKYVAAQTDDPTEEIAEAAAKAIHKEWQPYEGPRGGEGWQHTETGEVVYQDEKPQQPSNTAETAPSADGASADADGDTDPVAYTDLDGGDEILFEGQWFNEGTVMEGEIQERLPADKSRPNGAYVIEVTGGERDQFADERVIFPSQIAEVVNNTSGRDSASGPDARAPDHVSFDELTEGDEIVFEGGGYDTDAPSVGEVVNTWPDSNRENITVVDDRGVERAVYPDDYLRPAGDTGTDDERDFEIPAGHDPGPDTLTADWFRDVAFSGMELRVYDKFAGEIRQAEIQQLETNDDLDVLDPNAMLQLRGDADTDRETYPLDPDTKRLEVMSVQDWDAMSEFEQHAAMMEHIKHSVNTVMMPDQTYEAVVEQARSNMLPAFKDPDLMREVTTSFDRLVDQVSRASCGSTENDDFYMKLQSDANPDTTNHEFGHGIIHTFGYDYRTPSEVEWPHAVYDNRPWKMAHDHREKRDDKGLFQYDFGEDSAYLPPDHYMFQTPGPVPVELDPDEVELDDLDSSHTVVYEMDGETHEFEIPSGSAFHSGSITSVNHNMDRDADPATYENLKFDDDDGTVTHTVYEADDDGRWQPIEESTGTVEAIKTEQQTAVSSDTITEGVEDQLAGVKYTDLGDREYDRDWGADEVADAFADLEAGDAVAMHVASQNPETGETEYEIERLVYTGRSKQPDPSFTVTQEWDFEDLTTGTAVKFLNRDGDVKREATVVDAGDTDDSVTIQFRATGDTAELTADEINQHRLRHATQGWDAPIEYKFRKSNGRRWTWRVDAESGELITHQGSSLVGVDYSRSEEVDAGLTTPAQPDAVNPDHPLAQWPEYNTAPESYDEKIRNLVRACNRSWYLHAKVLEEYANGERSYMDVYPYQIEGNYAAANAHETMAKTHEVMQTDDEDIARSAGNLVQNYPWLVHAYLDLFTPSETVADKLESHAEAAEMELDL